MKTVVEYLGKVSITVEEEDWSIDKAYDRLTLVTSENEGYISRTAVPKGVELTDTKYWKFLFVSETVKEDIRRIKQQITTIFENLEDLEGDLEDVQIDVNALKNIPVYKGTGAHDILLNNNSNVAQNGSTAEGSETQAIGAASHAEGSNTKAAANNSHAEGEGTEISTWGGHVEGTYNYTKEGIHIIGIGEEDDKKDAEVIDTDGNKYLIGVGGYEGTTRTGKKTVQTVINEMDEEIRNLDERIDTELVNAIFDVTKVNDGATFASLSALLSSPSLSTLIPTSVRTGGMTIRFVQSSDNNSTRYVQYMLKKQTWSASDADWEKMNLEDEVNTKVPSAFVNLFNANDENNADGYITASGGIIEYGNYVTSDYIPVLAGQTYYKASDSEKGFRFVLMYSAIGEVISGSYISSDTNSFTAVEGAKYARITFYSTNEKNQVSMYNMRYYAYNPVSKYIYDILGYFQAADVASILSRIGSIEQFDAKVPINDLTLIFKNVFAITDYFIDNHYYSNSTGAFVNAEVPTYACTQKIPVSCSYVRTKGFVQSTCLCYNGDSFIGTVQYNNSTDRKFVLLDNTTHIAFNIQKSSQQEGYREAGIIYNLEPYVPLDSIETRLDELEDFQAEVPLKQVKSLSSGIIAISDFFIDNHYYNNSNGKFVTAEVSTYACTSRIRIDNAYCYTYGFVQSSCLCYSGDSDDAFLGLVSYNNSTERKFTLLEGTTHIAFNIGKSSQPEGYKDSGIIFNLQPFVKDYDPIIANVNNSNVLYGKKWCVCGDSFSAWSTEQDGYVYKTYHYFIKNRNSMTIENMAVSGRTMAYPNDHTFDNAFAKQSIYQSIPADSDYVTLMLGINDASHLARYSPDGESTEGAISIGDIDSSDTGTFYGAWNVVMQWIFENRPTAHVGIIITNGLGAQGPNGGYSEYGMQIYTALKNIVKRWNVPFIDLNGGDGKTPMMQRGIYPEGTPAALIAAKWNAFAASPTSPYNGHTNVAGHLYESYCIEDFLRSL